MFLLLLLPVLPTVLAAEDNDTIVCQDGLLLPVWLPQDNLTAGDRVARGMVYFIALMYLFLGVSIISDRFMSAIEVITSQEREVTVAKKGGVEQKIVVRVWNETVANLTLMALGSSAPEILLSIIEIYAKSFQAGDLGPGTIVGSAAYNLFVIIALCISVIPNGETRKIKHLNVFFVTATWSVFAYVWLYVILAVISPGKVEVWEGILTFSFFPMTVGTAYIADRRIALHKIPFKKFRLNRNRVIVAAESADIEMDKEPEVELLDDTLEQARKDYSNVLRELRKQFPQKPIAELEILAKEQIDNSGPKSRAYYRVMATRSMTGGSMGRARANSISAARRPSSTTDDVTKFYFDPATYTVLENIGTFEITVVREGREVNCPVILEYRTEDGTATAGTDYVGASGTLVFKPGDTQQTINLQIIDDDLFEEDEHFFVHLTDLKVQGQATHSVKLVAPKIAKVLILDDDHSGVFSFPEATIDVPESEGMYELPVERSSGARGKIRVPYRTEDGTGKAGKDYVETHGYVIFEDNETRRTIPIGIVPEHCYERNVSLYVELGEPEEVVETERSTRSPSASVIAANAVHSYLYGSYGSLGHKDNQVPNNINHKREEEMTSEEKIAMEGRPKLGAIARVQINIRESDEFKNTVDKLVQKRGASAISVSTSSWGEQFAEAIRVNPEPPEGEEDGLPETTGCGGYLIHFLTIFWKILFAFVPPADMCSGYLCFVFSIFWIGVLTAVIGDLASHFGCTVGLQDAVTAITFVALGTSVPDTFASKVAAIQDATADNSIGNVTGSNAVNVFLGIGVAWSIAAIYHAMHGNVFIVPPGNLGFSVMLFCTEALFAIAVLMIRRSKYVGGELGGPTTIKYITSAFMFSLWLFYITMSTLEAYGMLSF
ncbi:sodium/calcium exchanger 1 isoform X2 [Macrosteles quadrilineatus]|uniref:sodium/calcium exchanger 1 isoform X2 n=1 Tax=Macrosteles quadrilineatus TaxID=74068 RepID=UPI0023E2434A|nr:sodium/calcium exchanger 1 isoform X2 [Macrosteles quadrilineatus]